MYLLSVTTLTLHSFIGEPIPPYAILSHVWGPEEVSYVLMAKPKHRSAAKLLAGFSKIEMCCKQAQRDGHQWVWVDTCCIDKRSSAELSEAINSMFVWYRRAACCYVYLFDVNILRMPDSDGDEDEAAGLRRFGDSRWFTRGWTLQELLAPRELLFFDRYWTPIGYLVNYRLGGKKVLQTSAHNGLGDLNIPRPVLDPQEAMDLERGRANAPLSHRYVDLASQLSFATKIPEDYLTGKKALRQACVAQRMFWASRRKTTREEDRAYSLMGLFDINMPILYGEGLEKAFTRLQYEIMRRSPDQSILLWYKADETSYRLLADSPDCFLNSGDVVQGGKLDVIEQESMNVERSSFIMTNLGLRITLPILDASDYGIFPGGSTRAALLSCAFHGTDSALETAGLNLLYLGRDIERSVIYCCQRPPNWVTVTRDAVASIQRVHLCGNDYISTPKAMVAFDTSKVHTVLRLSPERIKSAICEILARVAGVSVDDLTGETKIEDLGIDSLMALEVMGELSEAFGTWISLNIFFTFSDIESMCFYCRE